MTKNIEEVIGTKYGKWTIIGKSQKKSKSRELYVDCVCECGIKKPVSLRNLIRGVSKSCGCSTKELVIKTRDVKEESGNRYDRLLVIDRAERRGNWDIAYWNCLCDCGNRCLASGHDLRLGRKRSCGCLLVDVQRERNTKSPDDVAITKISASYKHGAKRRGLIFNLDREQIKNLIFSNCFYCGKEPTNIFNGFKNKSTHNAIKYNGIDRKDNLMGYSIENCVTCCMYCNMSKRDMTIEEFRSWIVRVYNNFINQNQG